MMDGRYLFVDPSLCDARGHHADLLRRYAERVGEECLWPAVSRHAARDLDLPGHVILRRFRYTMGQASRVRRLGRIAQPLGFLERELGGRIDWLRTKRAARSFDPVLLRARADAATAHSLHTRDLQTACSAFAPSPRDRIVFESGDAEQGLALAQLLEQGSTGSASLHFRLMYDDVSRHPTDLTWASVLARLQRAAPAGAPIHFSTETQAFSRAVQHVVGGAVAVRPHPSALCAMPPPATPKPFVVLVPGEMRSDKGSRLLDDVVRRLGTACRGVIVRMQADSDAAHVEPLPARLGAAAYKEAWAGSHAALLLHDATVYRLRGSGTVCDAVAAGRPFVCLAGSSLAEWVVDGNGIAVPAEPAAIIAALGQLIDNYTSHLARAAAARGRLLRLAGREFDSAI